MNSFSRSGKSQGISLLVREIWKLKVRKKLGKFEYGSGGMAVFRILHNAWEDLVDKRFFKSGDDSMMQ